MITRFFFTFGNGTPYRNHYVEVHVRVNDPYANSRDLDVVAREAMNEAHGNKFAFQYSDDASWLKQVETFGLKRLSLLARDGNGRWSTVG